MHDQLEQILAPLTMLLPGTASVAVLGVSGEPIATFGGGPQGAVDPAGTTRRSLRCRVRTATIDEIVCTFDEPASGAERTRDVIEASLEAVVERLRLELDMESMQSQTLSMMEQQAVIYDVLPALAGQLDEEGIVTRTLAEARRAVEARSAAYLRVRDGLLEPALCVDADDSRDRGRELPAEVFAPVRYAEDPELREIVDGGGALLGDDPRVGRTAPAALARLVGEAGIVMPVRYGDQGDSETIGLVVTSGVREVSYLPDDRVFGSNERQSVGSFAAILGAVLGARESARYAGELQNAREIQQMILPSAPPRVPGFTIKGDSETSGFVGGDYYDYVRMADGRTLVVVADVSGHNLASGMIMVEARASLRALAAEASDLADLFDRFAASIHPDLAAMERFITAVALAVEPGTGRIEVVNAGHNDTLVRRADGRIEHVVSDDTVLGFMAGARHDVGVIELSPGDAILVYTDGITEAQASDGEMYGEERIDEVLRRTAGAPADDLLGALFESVEEFQSGTSGRFGDDVTAVVLEFLGQT